MSRTSDGAPRHDLGDQEQQDGSHTRPEPGAAGAGSGRVLLVDMDRAMLGLLEEWLAEQGYRVVADCGCCAESDGPFDLVVVDVPFPRDAGPDVLRRLAARYPGTPIFALSSSFFGGVPASGAVARALGADCVLPKPLTRATLVAAVQRMLGRKA